MVSDELKLAASFIRDGQRRAARQLLIPYVKTHPRDANAWLLLSHALDDPARQIDCVKRSLRINPGNPNAKARLQALVGDRAAQKPAAKQSPEKAPPFIERDDQASVDLTPDQPRSTSEPNTPGWEGSIRPIRRDPGAVERPPAPQRPPGGVESKPSSPKARSLRAVLVLGASILCLVAVTAGMIGFPAIQNLYIGAQSTQSARRVAQIAQQLGTAQPTLPPSWTPTPEPTITTTPTITATFTQTPHPTLVGPSEQELEEMQAIQIEVADLRGLSVTTDVQTYLLDKGRVRPILEDLFYSSGGTEAEVEDQKRGLVALGLVKPTYNLFDNILNNIADGIGGFYDPQTKEIFVLGFLFGGVEHYIYSHEFGHALVDQHYPLDAYGNYPICLTNEDQCKALDALIEGDATLLMDLWWDQYASLQDYQDILRYNPPWYTLPDQFPPPYASRDALFPYYEGRDFVEYLFTRGNWARVNQAYEKPPESTEQILHPQKYLAGESPIIVQPEDLALVLGEGWRELSSDTLGEWGTYMLLGYSADIESQIELLTAERATAGWGGDTYQIYYNDSLDQTTMSARWVWDSSSDAAEFHNAMLDYLDSRFRGAKVNRSDGQCWEANNQASCIFRSGRETLWLLAPNQTIMNGVLAAIPGFP